MKLLRNPFSFTPLPVTIITSVVYAALIISLLVVHHVVPEPRSILGIDLDEAWLDLQTLSNGFHPYNSHRNDEVRNWLLQRIEALTQATGHGALVVQDGERSNFNGGIVKARTSSPASVLVFSDLTSNVSFSSNGTLNRPACSTYFEGTNIMVYIRGSDDDPSEWWLKGEPPEGTSGVLVNAHYDSVSTGYGATDDGVGVVTILQLIKYFSAPTRQPKKGIIALLNNGEEDFLNGARAFSKHPLSNFPKTFLNLEGAGAGGRATLFRSTDADVTRQYQQSPHPFGNVVSRDAFQRGFIKSDTDYSVFTTLGMRGLDVAFYEPRGRYHTDQDDTKHTGKSSIYHMLSAATSTMQRLTDASIISSNSGQDGSEGVWFDLFGSAFAVFQLHTLFALSVTLLVVAPLTLAIFGLFLHKTDRSYILSGKAGSKAGNGDEPVSIKGRRGVIRWPVAFILSSAIVIGLAFLIIEINPYIVYSSPYAVWSMMLSAWLVVTWLFLSTANHFRPTAFQRLYSIMWVSLGGWIVLIAATVAEQKQKIAGTYLVFFYHACIFLATTICLLELFGLPRKSEYVAAIQDNQPSQATGIYRDSGSISSAQRLAPSDEEDRGGEIDENVEDDDERTSLIRGSGPGRTTFKHYTSPNQRADVANETVEQEPKRKVYGLEQPWSHSLPSSLWLLEFLIIAAMPIIFIGQTSLLISSALPQTLADGSDPLLPYLAISLLSILLLLPLGPFLHRYTYHIPLFLFLVFIGTLLYNLLAFPFSPANRLKISFIQRVDLETGLNNVTLSGINRGPYLHDIVSSLPSTAHQTPTCNHSTIHGLKQCTYTGIPPNTVPGTTYQNYLSFNISLAPNSTTSAHFRLSVPNTRACKLLFQTPITDFHITGSGPPDPRYHKFGANGSTEMRLWSRTWEREWRGKLHWGGNIASRKGKESHRNGAGGAGIRGRVVCLWSDANAPGAVPALEEVWRFAPGWVAVTKAGDGLVEGWKYWSV